MFVRAISNKSLASLVVNMAYKMISIDSVNTKTI